MSYTRSAYHAGAWYSSNVATLNKDVGKYLATAKSNLTAVSEKLARQDRKIKFVIAPHAGLRYSGLTAAHSYSLIDPTKYNKIVMLGPSHKFYLNNLCLSGATTYETPLGNFPVDLDSIVSMVQNSKQPKMFSFLNKKLDENEHSLEMQMPFLGKIFAKNSDNVKLIPMLVGDFTRSSSYNLLDVANLLLPYFEDENCLFIISSDFCHWGDRFGFTNLMDSKNFNLPQEIHKNIEYMDKQGVKNIMSGKQQAFNNFKSYLDQTENTICGRNPILLLLKMIELSRQNIDMEFVHYSQSNLVTSFNDGSVSYAGIIGF